MNKHIEARTIDHHGNAINKRRRDFLKTSGALMVTFAQGGPAPLVRLALTAALAAAATLCAVRMIRAYGEARRLGKSDLHAETAA